MVVIGFLVYLTGATVQAMRIRRSHRLTVSP
jgi:hypothetical protein